MSVFSRGLQESTREKIESWNGTEPILEQKHRQRSVEATQLEREGLGVIPHFHYRTLPTDPFLPIDSVVLTCGMA